MPDDADTEDTGKRPVLRFYIGMDYDARTRVAYRRAPANWSDMSEADRTAFLEEEADTWAHEQLEWGAQVYDPAERTERDGWEQGGHPSEPEEYYD